MTDHLVTAPAPFWVDTSEGAVLVESEAVSPVSHRWVLAVPSAFVPLVPTARGAAPDDR
jgi:hypothetical protein